ncbi:MAG TPA: hypothetical protein VFS43_14845 [Polyangiaceae bacterium]|nr:hypothetical protein [Polyangiaceae bacterium]
MMRRWQRALGGVALAALASACAHIAPTRDGQLVFAPGAGKGASVLTANGVEYVDRAYHPKPVLRTSASEDWRPATGFLMPPDGVWRYVSSPLSLPVGPLALTLRASDAYVPAWGGEVLLRVDAAVDAAAFPGVDASRRAPMRLVVVWAAAEAPEPSLLEGALGGLGEGDRVAVVDALGPRVVVPPLPGAERTLVEGALRRRFAAKRKGRRDVAGALQKARALLAAKASAPPPGAGEPFGRVVVVSDGKGLGPAVAAEVKALGRAGAGVLALGARDAVPAEALAPLGAHAFAGPLEVRADALARALPPPADEVLGDVVFTFSSAPAPVRVLEASGGEAFLGLEGDSLYWEPLRAGQARTEIVRLALPPWTPQELIELSVSVRYEDLTRGGYRYGRATLSFRFSDDMATLGATRHGDVIAYASALAMVRRLGRTFLGGRAQGDRAFRELVAWQAESMDVLAREYQDPRMGVQGETLRSLLGALDE